MARGGKPAEVGTPRAATTLAQRIACIPGDDPQRQRKAVRLFLETRIAREPGAHLLNDPAFASMLDAIDRALRQDAEPQ